MCHHLEHRTTWGAIRRLRHPLRVLVVHRSALAPAQRQVQQRVEELLIQDCEAHVDNMRTLRYVTMCLLNYQCFHRKSYFIILHIAEAA